MEDEKDDLPPAAQGPLSRFDYFSNRIKLEYLSCCCTKKFNPDVINELKGYYGQDVLIAGGMNEAFRWFLGNPDVEVIEALPTGEPFVEHLDKRKGSGNLFVDYDPRMTVTYQGLKTACQQITDVFLSESNLERRIAILAEYLAIKVTCHDLFIHGRSDLPATNLFNTPYVHIQPERENDYLARVAASGLDEFKLKNLLSYAMASGIDPVECLSLDDHPTMEQRQGFTHGLKGIFHKLDTIEWDIFFKWDIYGICNFLEGPVFLRRSKTRRSIRTIRLAWMNYHWNGDSTATQASDFLVREAFDIVFDHSKVLRSCELRHFMTPSFREAYLDKVEAAKKELDVLHKPG